MNERMLITVPVGIEDFKELKEKSYFVDKSRFIKELLDYSGTKVSLFTRPRRFGKTLMLSMLLYFFSIDNADENRKLFAGLEIENEDPRYMARQGSAPVLFLTLKNIYGKDYTEFLSTFSQAIARFYRNYECILEGAALSSVDRETFRKILNGTQNESVLQYALLDLSYFLNKYYKRKPIILIDEYDAPIVSSWEHQYYTRCINFMRNFYGTCLKTNNNFDFAVLSGVTRISKESIFSGLNNFEVYSILSNEFDDIFGFTDDELTKTMQFFDVSDNYKDVKEWYDGYIFGRTEIYNPLSVMKYLKSKCVPQAYWTNTSSNSIIKELLKDLPDSIYHDLADLLNDNTVDKYIDESLLFDEMKENRNSIFSLLAATGYLKVIKKDYIENKWLCKLKIPNKEIYSIYKTELCRNLSPDSEQKLDLLLASMISGNENEFSRILQDFLIDIVSFFDTTKKLQESFYHGLILGLIASLRKEYYIKSNGESGYGRFDIACIPKRHTSPGILLEFKSSKSKKVLSSDADNALKQIESNKYDTIFHEYKTQKLWKYGIAFYKKNVVVKMSAQ